MTSRCELLQEDLKAYQDGELSLVRRLTVRSHLARCAACREEMTIMEQISNEVRSTESGALDPALRAKILTNIASEGTPVLDEVTIPKKPISPKTRFRLQLAEYGAFVTVVIVAGVFVTTIMGNKLNRTFSSASNSLKGGDDYASQAAAPVVRPPLSDDAPDAASGSSAASARTRLRGARSVTNWDFAPTARGAGAKRQSIGGPIRSAKSEDSFRKIAPSPNYTGSTAASQLPSTMRRVHKEARVTVEVKKLEEQSDAVESMVKSAGGFVVSNTLSTGGDGTKTATLDIKVPVKQFETVLKQIGDLGEVKAKNVSGQDLTEQHSDAQAADNVLSSELSVKEAMLREARAKAAKKKDFVLNDWQQRAEVRRLRIEAAQVRARLELLRRTSDLSNISVQLQEPPHLPGQGGFLEGIGETGRAASESFLVAARLPINLLIWILAYSPLWIPLLIAYHYATRVYGRRTPPP